MVKAIRKSIFLITLAITVFMLAGCKKDKPGTTIYNVYAVDFYVNNNFYCTNHVFEGETLSKPEDPDLKKYNLESHVFLYWTYSGIEYNFSSPVDHSFRLDAFIEEPALLDIFTNSSITLENTSLELIENSLYKESICINSTESKFSRYFYLQNSKDFDVTFDFIISSASNYPISFYLRNFKDAQEENYKTLNEWTPKSITIEANTTVLFSIDWIMLEEMGDTDNITIKITLNNYKRAAIQ